jgi:hypothetical protein
MRTWHDVFDGVESPPNHLLNQTPSPSPKPRMTEWRTWPNRSALNMFSQDEAHFFPLTFLTSLARSTSFAFKILSAKPTPALALNSSGTSTDGLSRDGPPPIASCFDREGRGT